MGKDENRVLRAGTHREIKCRASLSKDRTINLLKAVQRLQAVTPEDDPRLIHILDLSAELFTFVKNALDTEDKLEAEILKLSSEVGRCHHD